MCKENDKHGRYMIVSERIASRRNLNGLICKKKTKQFCDFAFYANTILLSAIINRDIKRYK